MGPNPDPHAHPVPKTLPARIDLPNIGRRNELRGDLRPARRGRPPAANAILRDAALAEDVVQEVFERVWRGSGHDERRGPLGPYLKLLARSRALDLWRRTRTAERAQERLEAQAGPPPARTQLPEAALAGALDRRLARAAVRRLPDAQRQAIGLAFWGGLSAQELAAAEGIPLGTAKSRLRLGAHASCHAIPHWRPSGSGCAVIRLAAPPDSYKQVSQPTPPALRLIGT